MKNRFLIMAASVLMVLSLSACGTQTRSADTTTQEATQEAAEVTEEVTPETTPEATSEASETPEAETTEGEATPQETASSGENVLIAYFTWADNTHVENPDAVDVDASTSASVLAPGNVARIASWIQEEIGGDLFSIQVEDPYSSDYDECLERASEENAQDARPALATHVENMDQYDTIYLGYPNWWYSCPMALLSFLDEYDFSGKHIVLFCSHGTGGLAGSVEAIRDALPDDCTIEENVLGVYRPEVAQSQGAVLEWLEQVR